MVDINEATQKPLDKIDWLLRNGLVKDLNKLPYYRIAIQNPQNTVQNVVFRDMVAEICENLLQQIFSDNILYDRLRRNLLAKNKPATVGYISRKAFESLIDKSEKSGILLEELCAQYDMGIKEARKDKLQTNEQQAFNRVNKYIAENKKSTLGTIKRVIKK